MGDIVLETILNLAERDAATLPVAARQRAHLSLYDWLVCGLAGRAQPVANKIREFARAEGGTPIASLFGGAQTSPRTAALVNGTISHALDYDDTHFAHIGHLSVGIYPAALAAAEETDSTVSALIDAFVLGAEAAICVGLTLGPEHYDRGFHQTATAGAFGACIAAARLYGLNRHQTSAALNLCATRASGLKSQFGTMGKPYNAGIAASNGIETAKLALLGFSAPTNGLSGPQGFIATHSQDPQEILYTDDKFLFEDVSYKFHACCHGTHAMIEALLAAQRQHSVTLSDIGTCRIRTNPRWMNVCNIATPKTGLEVKFSYRWLAGMALDGRPTGSAEVYSDALADDTTLAKFAKRVDVVPDETVGEMQTHCTLERTNGETIETQFDLQRPMPADAVQAKLRKKAEELLYVRAHILDPVLNEVAALRARDIGEILRHTEVVSDKEA